MSTDRIRAVAWRDFKATALTKAFLFAVVGVPVLMVGVIGIAAWMMSTHEEPPLEGTVLVAAADVAVGREAEAAFAGMSDEARAANERVRSAASGSGDASDAIARMADAGMATPGAISGAVARGEVRVAIEASPDVPPNDDDLPDAVRDRLLAGELLAAAFVRDDAVVSWDVEARPSYDLYVADGVDSDHIGLIERALGEAVVRVRATSESVEEPRMRRLLRAPRADTKRLSEKGEATNESREMREIKGMAVPMVFMMLLWTSAFATGNQLLMSTIEEKSNRVMEVLLSAISPMQLLCGKIIGQGLVGLLVVGVYSALGLAALVVFARMDLVTTEQLVAFGLFFFMAYFMVAAMMATVGSAVSDIREANNLLTPVMILLMIPLMLWMPISQAPNGMVATVFSYLPPAIPFVMILRVCSDEGVPLVQLITAVVWGYACVVGMIWMAGRVFRVGVLMTGKPPTPLELLRWLRYS